MGKEQIDKLIVEGDAMAVGDIGPQPNDIVFHVGVDQTNEILKLCENGDIYVKGKLIENDKEVVDGLREFLAGVNK